MNNDFDLEAIRALHPAAGPASDSARHAARDRLFDKTSTGPAREHRRATRQRRALRPAWAILATVALAAAAIAVSGELETGPGGPTSAAAAVLERAARLAEVSGGPRELRPGEYWYVESRALIGGVMVASPRPGGIRVIVNALQSVERQAWLGVSTRSYVKTRPVGPITFLTAAAKRQWIGEGRPAQFSQGNFTLPADPFSMPYRELLALPSNVDALYRLISGRAGNTSRAWHRHEMFTIIGDLLREAPVPAPVRAALYRVAARIPGIRLLGLTHDDIGRPALAVALNDTFDGYLNELLFDPRTAKLLGDESVLVTPPPTYHVKPGLRTGTTYINSGIVQHIGELPRR